MNYNSYYHELLANIREERNNWKFDQTAFFVTACEILKDCNAIVDYEPTYLREREGTKMFMAIDGYDQASFDQDESIVIIACDDGITNRVNNEPHGTPTIIAKECNHYFNGMRNFILSAINGKFFSSHEESRPEYGLASFIYENRNSIARFRFYFLTDRLYTGREDSLAGISTAISDIYGKNSNVEAHIWDLRRLHDAMLATAPQEQLSIDLTQYKSDGVQAIQSPKHTKNFTTYLAFFTGDVLADLYEKYGAKLMEANVRSFLSTRGKVNKGIRGTLRNNPEHFVAFNNGITATATGMRLLSDKSSENSSFSIQQIDNLQIVNGGQTTASIFYAGKKDKVNLKDVIVPAKIVLLDDVSTANELIPDISRFTNSQNKVAEADLSSNSDFQRRLEKISRQVLTPPQHNSLYQTHWYYERARGQYESEKNRFSGSEKTGFIKQNPKNQIIKMIDGAKYLLSWDRQPDIVSLGGQKCFASFAKQMSKLSEDELELIDANYYRTLAAKKILFDTARHFFMTKAAWYKKAYLANITAYAVSKIAEDCAKIGKTLDFDLIWQKQSIPESLMSTIDEAGRQASAVLNDELRPVQNVTEWAKRKACWQKLQKYPTCITGVSDAIIDSDVRRPRHAAPSKHNLSYQKRVDTLEFEKITDNKHGVEDIPKPQSAIYLKDATNIQESSQTYLDKDFDKLLELPHKEKLNWMLSIPSEQWRKLYDFALRRRILSPKAEASLAQLMNKPNNENMYKISINMNAINYLLQRAIQLGFHIE